MALASARFSGEFQDVSVLGGMLGWELGFHQLDAGDATIVAQAMISAPVTISRMRFDRRFHQLGRPPAHSLSFGVPLVGMQDWFGQPYEPTSILPFNHPNGIDGVSENGFDAFAVSISRDFLNEVAAAFGIPVPDSFERPMPESVIRPSRHALRFRARLSRLMDDPSTPVDSQFLADLVLSLLQAGQPESAQVDASSPEARARALRKALADLGDHRGEVVTVRDLCARNDISVRTLNRAFNERFGIGPKAYLKRQRLSGARNDLLRGRSGTMVADVANRWGFWHLGQFARDYRLQFGELPSETLRRSSRSTPQV